jgi:hypothetical protein
MGAAVSRCPSEWVCRASEQLGSNAERARSRKNVLPLDAAFLNVARRSFIPRHGLRLLCLRGVGVGLDFP